MYRTLLGKPALAAPRSPGPCEHRWAVVTKSKATSYGRPWTVRRDSPVDGQSDGLGFMVLQIGDVFTWGDHPRLTL